MPRSPCTGARSRRPTPATPTGTRSPGSSSTSTSRSSGNGDIWEASDALRMVEQTGVAGVVVGRGCLGRPWLFRDLAAAFAGEPVATLPTLGEVAAMMRRHAELLCEHMGEERGCKEFRKHVSWYLKGFAAGGELRRCLALVDSLAGLDRLLAELDQDEPFPTQELGTPRADRARRGLASYSPRGGWTTRTAAVPTCTRTPPSSAAGDSRHPESVAEDSEQAPGLCFTRCSLPGSQLRNPATSVKSPVRNS